ncbi:MAG: two-component system, OmpR family, response regulator [Betaproteobacteria bacterium]|jgi:two-component system OmpR family response regulator
MASNGSVLIVEDDRDIREMVAEYLGGHGYEVCQAQSGGDMRDVLERCLPDVVLLDVKLPGEDGLTLARYLRERYDVGIIMVTAAREVIDRVVGLEIGADDYVTKPFDPRELLARVKSVMRRVQSRAAAQPSVNVAPQRVAVGRCFLDVASHQLMDVAGQEVPMTSMEFDLLKVFVEHPNRVLSRDQILTLTRNRDWEPFDRSIDIRIARLRRKVEPDPNAPKTIRTIRGSGYMFVPPQV